MSDPYEARSFMDRTPRAESSPEPEDQQAKPGGQEPSLAERLEDVEAEIRDLKSEFRASEEGVMDLLRKVAEEMGITPTKEVPASVRANQERLRALEAKRAALAEKEKSLRSVSESRYALLRALGNPLISKKLAPQEEQAMRDLSRYCASLSESGKEITPQVAREVSIATVGLLDAFVIDEMAPPSGKIPGYTEVYSRSAAVFEGQNREGYHYQSFFGVGPEADSAMSILRKHLSGIKTLLERAGAKESFEVAEVRDFAALKNEMESRKDFSGVYYVESPISPEEAALIERSMDSVDYMTMVICNIRLNETVSAPSILQQRNGRKGDKDGVDFSLMTNVVDTLTFKKRGIRPLDNVDKLRRKLSGAGVRNEDINLYDLVSYANSRVPRQDLWQGLLENGLRVPPDQNWVNSRSKPDEPALAESQEAGTGPVPENIEGVLDKAEEAIRDNRTKSAQLRRTREYIRNPSPEYLEGRLEEIKNHYEREFYPRPGISSEFVPTRSGVSANKLAIEIVHDKLGDKAEIGILPGFYYEHDSELEEKFTRKEDFEGVRALFLNSQPSDPVRDRASYEKNRDEAIASFLDNARKHPGESFCLVVDKTMNLDFMSFNSKQDLPENVTVMETFSLSKNPRDNGRNYFFGGVNVWGPGATREELNARLAEVRGTMTPHEIIHFPQETQEKISEKTERLRRLQAVFSESFFSGLGDTPGTSDWEIQGTGHYVFLVNKRVYELSRYAAPPGGPPNTIPLQENDRLGRLMDIGKEEYLELESKGLLVVADSFGFPESRYSVITPDLRSLTDSNIAPIPPSTVPTDQKRIRVPRVTLGVDSTEEQMRALGSDLGKYFASKRLASDGRA